MAFLTILGSRQLVATHGNGFRLLSGSCGSPEFATGCDWLQPLGSISAPCLVGRMGYDVDFSSTT